MSEQHQEKLCQQVRAFLERQHITFDEKEEPQANGKPKRFDAQYGRHNCVVKVFLTRKILVQGTESPLSKSLVQMKEALEGADVVLGTPLPFEIESFPQRLIDIGADAVIVQYIEEAIICIKQEALLGGSFLLGTASERAIWNLIAAYTKAIADEANKASFEKRTSKRFISVAYDEFKSSFSSSKSKPTDAMLTNELIQQIDDLFDFYRRCRNKIGHPQIPPDLNKGAILANMGQFITYVEVILKLEEYLSKNPIVL